MAGLLKIPRIHPLDVATANQIAAGEVVERPMSVVKELMENALDASATEIAVEIEAGGTKFIRVRDNGQGIHPDDMQLALQAQTTSKLRSVSDLDSICSLGFRGEALSSIAAVSDFALTSCCAETADRAYRIRAQNDTLQTVAHPRGTTVEVRDLFSTVPARRKFLKTEKTEYLRILQLLRAFSLGYNTVSFRLVHDGKQTFYCSAATTEMEKRIAAVLGKSFIEDALSIACKRDNISLHAWLGNPSMAQLRNDHQYIFVNGRLVKDRVINHALQNAVADMIPRGKYLRYLLRIDMDPAAVDVNVHPSKRELKFRQQHKLHDLIYDELLAGIHKSRILPDIDPVDVPAPVPKTPVWRDNPAKPETAHMNIYQQLSATEAVREVEIASYKKTPPAVTEPLFPEQDYIIVKEDRAIIQLADSQLLFIYSREKIILADIPTAQKYLVQRILQEEFADGVAMDELRVPVSIRLPEKIVALAEKYADRLLQLGIEVNPQGIEQLAVRALPKCLPLSDPQSLLQDIVALLEKLGNSATTAATTSLCECLAAHANDTLPDQLEEILLTQLAARIVRLADDQEAPWRIFSSLDWQSLLKKVE